MPARRSTWAPWRNLVRNTAWAGAIAGTPGTAPRGVSLFDDPAMSGNGLQSQIVGVTQEAGLRRLNWRFSGVAAGSGNIAIDLAGLVRVRPGERLTHSCFVRIAAQGNVNPLDHAIQINEYDAAGGFLAANSAAYAPQLAPISQQRWAVAGVRVSAATAAVRAILGIYYVTGQEFDFTLGIALPQLERSGRVTAPQRRQSI